LITKFSSTQTYRDSLFSLSNQYNTTNSSQLHYIAIVSHIYLSYMTRIVEVGTMANITWQGKLQLQKPTCTLKLVPSHHRKLKLHIHITADQINNTTTPRPAREYIILYNKFESLCVYYFYLSGIFMSRCNAKRLVEDSQNSTHHGRCIREKK
jgi:hypothetical protein